MDRHEEPEGLAADLPRIEALALGRRRILSLGALGSLAALGACAAPSGGMGGGRPDGGMGGGGMGGPPPGGRRGPPPGGFGGPGGPPPGGFGGPPPQVDNGPALTGTALDGSRCTAFAIETQGPYPADGSNGARGSDAAINVLGRDGVQRRDIRTGIGGATPVEGVPLDLTLRLVDVNMQCMAMTGYALYIWHCDAQGRYSLYDVPGETWLRGLQVADSQGVVRFTTIVPGCYMGRYPHIHFEVFSSLQVASAGRYARLTSQLALPAPACEATYALPAYAAASRTWPQSRDIARDMVFGDNGAERIKAMTLDLTGSPAEGFRGSATIGIVG